MADTIPNVQLRAWRNKAQLTRAELAARINATPTGIKDGLNCDEERIRRWEAGEVSWPHSPYRLALTQATGLPVEDLGFSPTKRRNGSRLIETQIIHTDALRAEADLYGTMELAQQLQASDVGPGTLEALAEAVELLPRLPGRIRRHLARPHPKTPRPGNPPALRPANPGPAPRTPGHHRLAYRPTRLHPLRPRRTRRSRNLPPRRLRNGPPGRTRRTHGMGTRDVRLVRPGRRPLRRRRYRCPHGPGRCQPIQRSSPTYPAGGPRLSPNWRPP